VGADDRLKVLWLAPYPFASGGPSSSRGSVHPAPWLSVLARSLEAEGTVDLRIASLSRETSTRVLDETSEAWSTEYLPAASGYLKLATAFMRDAAKLRRYVREWDPDVVHGHGTEGEYGVAATKSGYPSVLTIQGMMARLAGLETGVTYRRARYAIMARHESAAIRDAGAIVANTEFAAEFAASIAPNARIARIPNPVSRVFFETTRIHSTRGPFFLSVGTLSEAKGSDVLVRAFLDVAADHPDVELLVVGADSSGFASRVLQPMVEADPQGHRVRFLGWVKTQAEIASLLSEAVGFVLPSLMENSPTVLMEAMVVGVPCIATNVGGIPELVSGGDFGILVPADDTQSLAEAMRVILDDPELAQEIAGGARRVARDRHEPDAIARETLDLYREVARNG
jgi:glycosyltransferase involved in cell wall biosynthesis